MCGCCFSVAATRASVNWQRQKKVSCIAKVTVCLVQNIKWPSERLTYIGPLPEMCILLSPLIPPKQCLSWSLLRASGQTICNDRYCAGYGLLHMIGHSRTALELLIIVKCVGLMPWKYRPDLFVYSILSLFGMASSCIFYRHITPRDPCLSQSSWFLCKHVMPVHHCLYIFLLRQILNFSALSFSTCIPSKINQLTARGARMIVIDMYSNQLLLFLLWHRQAAVL